MDKENVKIDLSWLWSLLALIVVTAIGFLESGSALGAAIAFVIGFLACLSALLGLIPIIGPFLHFFFVYPAIQNAITGFQPGIHIPLTLLLILIVTTVLSILYTVVTTIFAAVAVSS